MIVRLMGQGQWRIDDGLQTKLNELDDQALEALEAGDEEALDRKLGEMWDLVQTEGESVPPQDLSPSDIIIPPSDLTLEETRELFQGDGLIPDLPT
ncbi:MAG: PspA-associated protein PspAA [Gaiellaceae bacterium]